MVCTEASELANNQEEADTKVFLCAQHANIHHTSESICIETVDSDIAIYALYFENKITSRIFINFITSSRRRIIDITDVALEIGEECCRALPALHAFTGNDYTSAFFGIGKTKAFKVLRESPEFKRTFADFGENFVFNSTFYTSLYNLLCCKISAFWSALCM